MKTSIFMSTLLLLLLNSSCCPLNQSKIVEKNWSYRDGYNIGNSLIFHEKVKISNDTIYRKGDVVAIILESKTRLALGDDMLVIADPTGQKIGQYTSN